MKVSVLPLGEMRTNCVIVSDEETGIGAVIDPGGTEAEKRIITLCESNGVKIKYILLVNIPA